MRVGGAKDPLECEVECESEGSACADWRPECEFESESEESAVRAV